jgi:hypothetical protein
MPCHLLINKIPAFLKNLQRALVLNSRSLASILALLLVITPAEELLKILDNYLNSRQRMEAGN